MKIEGPKIPTGDLQTQTTIKVKQRVELHTVGFEQGKKSYGTEGAEVRAAVMSGPGSEIQQGPMGLEALYLRAPSNRAAIDQSVQLMSSVALQVKTTEGTPSLSSSQENTLQEALGVAGDALGWSQLSGTEASASTEGQSVTSTFAEQQSDIISMAMAGVDAGLKDLALGIAEKQSQTTSMRNASTELQDAVTDGTYPTEVSYSYSFTDENGEVQNATETVVVNNEQEADTAISTLDSRMATVGDMTDLEIHDLKVMQQQSAEIMQTFAAILKNMHDTMMNTIRNQKG